MNKTCIVLVGPTAVGKTAVAIQLARHFNTAIISADSRQCYRELHIGVAKPSIQQLAAVPHYFIDSHSIQDAVTAIDFEKYALSVAENLFEKQDIIIIVGGTGLYIKAFCEGMDEIPAVDISIRNNIIAQFDEKGMPWLKAEIELKDRLFFAEGEMQNPQRMMRALEVWESTGKSIIGFQKGNKKSRPFYIQKILFDLPREQLYARINARVDQMIAEGLLEEVKSLVPFKNLNALQTVGYAELFSYLEGEISLDEAIENIKKNTRHYAKRQLTWFKKDAAFTICPPDINSILSCLEFNA